MNRSVYDILRFILLNVAFDGQEKTKYLDMLDNEFFGPDGQPVIEVPAPTAAEPSAPPVSGPPSPTDVVPGPSSEPTVVVPDPAAVPAGDTTVTPEASATAAEAVTGGPAPAATEPGSPPVSDASPPVTEVKPPEVMEEEDADFLLDTTGGDVERAIADLRAADERRKARLAAIQTNS